MSIAKSLLGMVAAIGMGDAVWLTLRQKYHDRLFQGIQRSPLEVRWIPAIFVYVILITSLYLGAVSLATSVENAAFRGAVVGFLMYAFYDLTNYATLTHYTLEMVITDALWGTVLCAVAALVGYFFTQKE